MIYVQIGHVNVLSHMGSTGFDSESNWVVSMSSAGILARKSHISHFLNGENNYALAA